LLQKQLSIFVSSVQFLSGSGVAWGRGASGGTRPGTQALGAHHHAFCSHLKTRLKQNLDQSML